MKTIFIMVVAALAIYAGMVLLMARKQYLLVTKAPYRENGEWYIGINKRGLGFVSLHLPEGGSLKLKEPVDDGGYVYRIGDYDDNFQIKAQSWLIYIGV